MPESVMIIGLGQIGMGYDLALESENAVYTHARAFATHPAFELLGAVDPAETQRDLFKKFYLKNVFKDISSAFQLQTPNVVVIASPTSEHNSVLKEVLMFSRPKAILCEKPIAENYLEACEMVEACETAGVKLFVNYMRRAEPGAIKIKMRIDSGEIPMPIKGVVWYSKGFLHNGSHFFNLLEFWLGPFVAAKVLDEGRLWDNKDSEPDVQVEFEGGKVVFISAWEEAFSHYSIELLSTSGRLTYEQRGERISWQSTCPNPSISGYKMLQTVPEMVSNDMIRYQWHVANQLANALDNKPHTLCTGMQSLATLEAMLQISNQR